MWSLTSLALFLGGFVAGVAACRIYIAYMRETVKLYETYIRQRIDAKWKNPEESPSTTADDQTVSNLTASNLIVH
jgi:hypothetical protein